MPELFYKYDIKLKGIVVGSYVVLYTLLILILSNLFHYM